MPYDPTDGVTLTELIRLVRLRLHDFPQKRQQTETGDGEKVYFRLHETVYDGDAVSGTVDGVGGTDPFTVDTDSSWLTYDAAPTGELVFKYSTVVWTNERITEAINAAIDRLFGEFYVRGENAALTTTTGGELLVETSAGYDLGPEDRVTKVEFDVGGRWRRTDCWHVRATPTAKYVVFERDPGMGQTVRVSYAVRPGPLDLGSQTLEGTSGLPGRAKEPLILYTVASLQVDRIHHRIRDAGAHNTQNENAVKSYEIQNDAQYLKAEAQVLAKKLSMEPLFARIAL